jgi:hypothetical protein
MRTADAEPGLKIAAADGLTGATNDNDDDEDVDDDTVSMIGGAVRGVLVMVLAGRGAEAEMSGARAGVDFFTSTAAAAMAG